MQRSFFEIEDCYIRLDKSGDPLLKLKGKHKKQLAEEIPFTPVQASQIDNDATFTKKNNKTYHGYKNHIQVDNKHKLIRKSKVTTASRHDSKDFADLVDGKGNSQNDVWADSAYRSDESEQMLGSKKLTSQVNERAYRNKPLSAKQRASNKIKSHIRVRVERVFGHMATAMSGVVMHVIGLSRVEVKVIMKNLAYNMQRFVFLAKHKQLPKCA